MQQSGQVEDLVSSTADPELRGKNAKIRKTAAEVRKTAPIASIKPIKVTKEKFRVLETSPPKAREKCEETNYKF